MKRQLINLQVVVKILSNFYLKEVFVQELNLIKALLFLVELRVKMLQLGLMVLVKEQNRFMRKVVDLQSGEQ